jgi:hypothetical protein
MESGNIEVHVGHGKATLKTCTIQMSSFKVGKPWNREPAQTSGRRRPFTATQQNVGAHGTVNGVVYSDTVGHDPNTILLLTSSLSRGGMSASDGAVILRLRPGAATLNIGARLPPASDNYLGTRFCMFQGMADILSVEEAELLGIRIPAGYVDKFFDIAQIEERFDVMEMSPASIAQPELQVVSTGNGQQIVEVAATPHRRLNFRR